MPFRPPHPVVLFLLSAVASLCIVRTQVAADDQRLEFFEKRIRPVLVEHCYQCHAADARNVRGGLLLDSRAGTLAGGDSGPAVVPGEPEESLLLSALRHESFEMPPEKKLPDSVIADFETWIQQGAVDPREGGVAMKRQQIDLLAGRTFWSFQPIESPSPPETDSSWPESAIDQFIAQRFSEQGLSAAADAGSDQILRRLYFVLIGLPPEPDEIRQFRLAWDTDRATAIAEVADRLLESPRFGERWGRHWLDVTRFAESSGGGRSLMFPHAWRFRDYVIQSFASDKPFDVLIREQIAGDLLAHESDEQFNEQRCGSAYLALGPTNYELQDKELLRMEVVDEQIDTVGRTFLGMTLGCARCHDHKFDPVPTREYYALAGIFSSTQSLVPGNVSGYVTTALRSEAHRNAMAQWNRTNQQLLEETKELQRRTGTSTLPKKGGVDPDRLPGIVVDDTQAEFTGRWIKSKSLQPWVGAGYRHDGDDRSGQAATFRTKLPEPGVYEVRLSHNYQPGRCRGVAVSVRHAQGTSQVFVDQSQAPADRLFSSLGQYEFEAETPAVVTIDAEQSQSGHIIVDAVQFLPVSDQRKPADSQDRAQLLQRLKTAQNEFDQHQKAKPELPVTMSVADQEAPEDGHIHIRGGVRNLGESVPRGFLSVASQRVDEDGRALSVEIADGTSGRLELADWIASPSNPLTTRVYVNRVWMHVIGEGLVRTPDNFGQTGQLPTHPQLLDYLASTFVTADQWSTKRLIRRLVTSHVFRLSSDSPDAADPENLYLARGFRRQLDAEAVRDSMLQISGQLDLSVTSGLTIEKLSTYDGSYRHGEQVQRLRSVYVPFLRNAVLETLDVFDVANPNVVSGRRNQTVLPGQALYLMNSPFVRQQAKLAADAFLAEHSGESRDRIQDLEDAWLLVLGRSPDAEETALMLPLLSDDQSPQQAWTAIFQALLGSIDFRFVD